MEIKFADAVRFFVTIAPKSNCYVCGTDRWEIPFSDMDNGLCFLSPTGATKGGVDMYNLNLECTKCGVLRVHRAEHIREWLDKNPEEGPKS